MKKTIFAAAFAITLLVGQMAMAQDATPRINHRQAKQQQRIGNGVKSGQLTPRETGHLEHREAQIQHEKHMDKAHGPMTHAERQKITRQQNHVSRRIYKDKHNARVQ